MIRFDDYPFSEKEIEARIRHILNKSYDLSTDTATLQNILGLIDLTTLEGSDHTEKIEAVCKKAGSLAALKPGIPNVAAVCFYPIFTRVAKTYLHGTMVNVAAVAGAFPSGQSPIHVKVAEVKYAVDEGADEIDMVISRGKLLEGNYTEVFDEIAAIREACGDLTLKVILETGELNSLAMIRKASEIAVNAGAGFLKTSTGKIPVGATHEAMVVMMDTVKETFEKTGRMVGVKASGGIATSEQALQYFRLLSEVLGETWADKKYFRFGASRLVDDILTKVLA